MNMSISLSRIAALVILFALSLSSRAAEPAVATTIAVGDLDCLGCAKKCAKHLYAVAGVAKVEANVEAKTITITPKPQTALSPLALWTAIEKGGKTPSKLNGPSGTFTAKPKQ